MVVVFLDRGAKNEFESEVNKPVVEIKGLKQQKQSLEWALLVMGRKMPAKSSALFI